MLDLVVVVIYLLTIVVIGTVAGKFSTTTSDFFFGGRRFKSWLVGMSCVATLVGSYSFVQYSQVGFNNGLPSMTPYTNEWFVLPVFLGVWLPIFYYNRLESVPEYFEKRFSLGVRQLVIGFLLIYLTTYVGFNLLTIGVAFKSIMAADPALSGSVGFDGLTRLPSLGGMIDWQLVIPAIIVAVLSAIYLHSGGQTSVIITDLIQGFLLLFVGLGVVGLGIYHVGGFGDFWSLLPEAHRNPFANFNHPPDYHFVGDFWNDAAVGSFAFYIINQGILMRFLSARSVDDGRKAMIFVALILMPLAAISVGGAGWIGQALVNQGALPGVSGREIFVAVSRLVTVPGIYGLVIAAVVAALMSTLDTLITALAAVVVNDIVRPMYPGQADEYYLKIAKRVAVVVTIIGVCLIPVFDQFDSIYQGLSHCTSVLIPPLVVVIVFGLFVPRYGARAAFWTLILGATALLLSMKFPAMITPLGHGVDPSGGYSYMRALFGLVSSSFVAGLLTLLMGGDQDHGKLDGLTAHHLDGALIRFKGSEPNFDGAGRRITLGVTKTAPAGDEVRLPQAVIDQLSLQEGDLLYITDTRWWWGGLRSVHSRVGGIAESETLEIPESLYSPGDSSMEWIWL